MTAHVHAEMIKAKADNMELVVFIKHNNEGEWKLMKYYNFPEFGGTHEYFLCLPQHKEAVLNALNGGESQTYRENSGEWLEAICSHGWNSSYWYMRNDRQSRIKPRKEKRWIAFDSVIENVYGAYKSEQELIKQWPSLQSIEIEVEI